MKDSVYVIAINIQEAISLSWSFFRTDVWPFCTQYPTNQCCCVCDVGSGRFDNIPGFPGI